uniref:F-box domain-containing protein n=1 Tax=Setaria italica TaxID=4555 RepID=K4A1E0_SETIT
IRRSLPSPMAPPPNPRSRASVRPLPLDALYEVLLRVPAKDLCRLRAVCRPWRSLLSDPHFVAAHTARHPEPLIVAATHHTDRSPPDHLLDIMDLSGRVIKRVVKSGSFWAARFAEDHSPQVPDISDYCQLVAVGKVASTGEYKVLRVLRGYFPQHHEQLCEVFNLDGSSNA